MLSCKTYSTVFAAHSIGGPTRDLPALTPYRASTTMIVGRARRGDSGALYSQSALARLNSSQRFCTVGHCRRVTMLRTGPHAAESCEPRQVRKKAAVSGDLRATWDYLV